LLVEKGAGAIEADFQPVVPPKIAEIRRNLISVGIGCLESFCFPVDRR
jgi:hypothetical protein